MGVDRVYVSGLDRAERRGGNKLGCLVPDRAQRLLDVTKRTFWQ